MKFAIVECWVKTLGEGEWRELLTHGDHSKVSRDNPKDTRQNSEQRKFSKTA